MEARSAVTAIPRVVFGMAAYGRADTLPRTLESLLSQTVSDLAIVIVDDRPTAEVKAIIDTYSSLDPRITYEANRVRLGMIANWRKAFERARTLYPQTEYFAWASDHDFWHPRWLESLLPVLDTRPEVVLAYPQTMRLVHGEARRADLLFDTDGSTAPDQRLRAAVDRMTAGNCIYGLFRADALTRAGVFRPVILPDRQVLLELATLGQFVQAREYLWYREAGREFSVERQRSAFFPGRVPVYTFLPACVQHFVVGVWDFAVHGCGRPTFGRIEGLRLAAAQLMWAMKKEFRLVRKRWWGTVEQTAIGRRLLTLISRPDSQSGSSPAPVEPRA